MNNEVIKILRRQMKLTQQEMADLFGVSQSTFHAWEHGYQKPRCRLVDDILDECWKLTAVQKTRVKSALAHGRIVALKFIVFN